MNCAARARISFIDNDFGTIPTLSGQTTRTRYYPTSVRSVAAAWRHHHSDDDDDDVLT